MSDISGTLYIKSADCAIRSVLETLNDTNIVPLIEVVNGINLEIAVLGNSIAGFILIVIVLYLRKSTR